MPLQVPAPPAPAGAEPEQPRAAAAPRETAVSQAAEAGDTGIGPPAQASAIQGIQASPRLAAQRRQLQAMFGPAHAPEPAAPPNRTGLPDGLKQGVESLSGIALDDVRVHYNSGRPAQLQAHAYAQGNQIHLAPGQQHHLAHEAWHVVQQKQGRVRAGWQAKGQPVNDDPALEREADAMGARAMALAAAPAQPVPAAPAAQRRAPASAPVQRARVLRQDDGEWLLIDVPSDGSCMLHAVNVAETIERQNVLEEVLEEPVRFTPEYIEEWVYEAVVDCWDESGEAGLEATGLALGTMNADLRADISAWWLQQLQEGDAAAVVHGVKLDVQQILERTLDQLGLLRQQRDEGEGAQDSGESTAESSEDTQSGRDGESSSRSRKRLQRPDAALDDEVDTGVPDKRPRLASEGSPSWDEPSPLPSQDMEPATPEAQPDAGPLSDEAFMRLGLHDPRGLAALLGGERDQPPPDWEPAQDWEPPPIPLDDVMAWPLAMGVSPGGRLDGALRDVLMELVMPHVQPFGRVPPASIQVPPAAALPDGLVVLYAEEFDWNERLWSGEEAVRAAAAVKQRHVAVHHGPVLEPQVVEAPLEGLRDGRLRIYNGGDQTHFQVMLGPFPPAYFALSQNGGASSSGSQLPAEDDERQENEEMTQADRPPPGVDEQTAARLRAVAGLLDEPFGGAFFQELYRAAVALDLSLAHAGTEELAEGLRSWRAVQEERNTRIREQRGSLPAEAARPEIVPLAGIVHELVQRGLPLHEVDALRAPAKRYVEFHRKRSTWKREHADERNGMLRQIAALLNRWAEEYGMADIARGPSVAEFSAREVHRETVGESMRAVLTIDPGELIGYEPEDYLAWKELSGELSGFVRAHLLNKHLGGPGRPANLSFLSDADNKKMSQVVEEHLKREILENNRRFFYKVRMPLGRPDLTQEPHHLAPELADRLPSAVELTAWGLEPADEGGMRLDGAFEGRPLPLDVERLDAGSARFAAQTPDARRLSKLQAHWRRKIADAKRTSGTGSIRSAMEDTQPVREKMNELQRRLLAAGEDDDAREQAMAEARQELEALGLHGEQLVQRLQVLAQRGRFRAASSAAVGEQDRKVDARRAKREPELRRRGLLDRMREEHRRAVYGFSDAKWKRFLQALDKEQPLELAIAQASTTRRKAQQTEKSLAKTRPLTEHWRS